MAKKVVKKTAVKKKTAKSSVPKTWLKNEIEVWREERLVNNYQADKLLDRYNIAPKKVAKQTVVAESKPVDVVKGLSIFGSIVLGLGIMLFVASNWQYFSNMVKTSILVGATGLTYFAGYHFTYNIKEHLKIGYSMLFLSTLIYGASIFLLTQIYQIAVNQSWLFFLWAATILPLVYVHKNTAIYLLSTIVFTIWNFAYNGLNAYGNYFYPIIAFFILLPLAIENRKRFIALSILVGISIMGLLGVNNHWLVLVYALCAFTVYYKSDEKKMLYLGSFLAILWNFVFSFTHVERHRFFSWINYEAISPNWFFLVILVGLGYYAYKHSDIILRNIMLVAGLTWALTFSNNFHNLYGFNGTAATFFALSSVMIFIHYFYYESRIYGALSAVFLSLWSLAFFSYFDMINFIFILPFLILAYFANQRNDIVTMNFNLLPLFVWLFTFFYRLFEGDVIRGLELSYWSSWAWLVFGAALVYYYKKYENRIYLILSSLMFFMWNIAFAIDFANVIPNFFYVLPLGFVVYLAIQNRDKVTFGINLFFVLIYTQMLVSKIIELYTFENINYATYYLMFMALAAVYYVKGIYFSTRDDLDFASGLMKSFGVLVGLIFAFSMSFRDPAITLMGSQMNSITYFTSFLAVASLAGLYYLKEHVEKYELYGACSVAVGVLVAMFARKYMIVHLFVFNAIVAILLLMISWFAFQAKMRKAFNVSVIAFAVFIFFKFIENTWDAIDRSIFFIVAGIVLIVGAFFLEKKRKELLEEMAK